MFVYLQATAKLFYIDVLIFLPLDIMFLCNQTRVFLREVVYELYNAAGSVLFLASIRVIFVK